MSKKELVDLLLNNFIDDEGNLDLNDLEFGDFKGDILISGIFCKGSIHQKRHVNGGNVNQKGHKNGGFIYQSHHTNEGAIYQSHHTNEGDIHQYGHDNKGEIDNGN